MSKTHENLLLRLFQVDFSSESHGSEAFLGCPRSTKPKLCQDRTSSLSDHLKTEERYSPQSYCKGRNPTDLHRIHPKRAKNLQNAGLRRTSR